MTITNNIRYSVATHGLRNRREYRKSVYFTIREGTCKRPCRSCQQVLIKFGHHKHQSLKQNKRSVSVATETQHSFRKNFIQLLRILYKNTTWFSDCNNLYSSKKIASRNLLGPNQTSMMKLFCKYN